MTKTLSGGCQCGRIRYSATVANDDAYLCHCRMCQRATGGFAAAFVNVPITGMAWESEPDWYVSSPIARRPFCASCGTPLGFQFVEDAKGIDLTLGSFDDPAAFVPTSHSGAESIHEAWLDTKALPRQRSDEIDSVVKHWQAAGRAVPE